MLCLCWSYLPERCAAFFFLQSQCIVLYFLICSLALFWYCTFTQLYLFLPLSACFNSEVWKAVYYLLGFPLNQCLTYSPEWFCCSTDFYLCIVLNMSNSLINTDKMIFYTWHWCFTMSHLVIAHKQVCGATCVAFKPWKP